MDFVSYQSRLSQLAARVNLMVFLVIGLLTANVVLSTFIWKVWKHHSVEIIPFSGSPTYLKSDAAVDAHYLSLMSENFIYSRLNVTPDNVGANHKRLLMFVDSAHYAEMLKVLTDEATLITTKKMSSSFDITSIRTRPEDLTSEIHGVLKRYVGLRALPEERLIYTISFRYTNGQLGILKFVHQKEGSHA